MGKVETEEMFRVFNMGIGLALIVSPYYADGDSPHVGTAWTCEAGSSVSVKSASDADSKRVTVHDKYAAEEVLCDRASKLNPAAQVLVTRTTSFCSGSGNANFTLPWMGREERAGRVAQRDTLQTLPGRYRVRPSRTREDDVKLHDLQAGG